MKKIAALLLAPFFLNCSTVTHVNLGRSDFIPTLDKFRGKPVSVQLVDDSIPRSGRILDSRDSEIQFVIFGDTSLAWTPISHVRWVDKTEHVDNGQGFVEGFGIGAVMGGIIFAGVCAIRDDGNHGVIYVSPSGCGTLGVIHGGLLGGVVGSVIGHRYITRYQMDRAEIQASRPQR